MMTVAWVLVAAVLSATLMHLSWSKAWNMYNLGKAEGAASRQQTYHRDYVVRSQRREGR